VTTIHQILKQYWNYDSFRPLQEDIIQSVMAGKDTLALLPTGGGKSICFQVPALAMEGVCLVVSPLIALMKDQVGQLKQRGISAVAVYSGMSAREIDIALDNCVFGSTKFLYLSPERLQTELVQERVKRMKVCLLAVDEAHCISQWGYDFRPPYLQIAAFRELLPKAPVLALTATATEDVKKDICDKLAFKEGQVWQQSFARPNLSYSCLSTEDKRGRLLEILNRVPGTAIVYVRSRRLTMEIASFLCARNIKAAAYHAGLSHQVRNTVQDEWIQNKVRVMVATNAFGLGIDKPDVRVVVHLDLPDTLEAYYQEAGRAGRDGRYAFAALLYGPHDAEELRQKTEAAHPPVEQLKRVYQALANYYQLAAGSGGFTSYDFNLDDFAATYRLKALEVHNALRLLQTEGFLLLNESYFAPAKIFIPIKNEDLYKYQVANKDHDMLLKIILRLYGGEVFTYFVPFSEIKVARQLGVSLEAVRKTLRLLHQRGIIIYEAQHDVPQVVFTTARYEVAELPLDQKKLDSFRRLALGKVKAVRDYILTTNQCRTQLLLAYFGENYAESCRICDYCLEQKKRKREQDLREEHRKRILALLQKEAQHPKRVVAQFAPAEAEQVSLMLRELVDLGLICYDTQGNLHTSYTEARNKK
jgi:ATP-dependent DNA helicase RecQ